MEENTVNQTTEPQAPPPPMYTLYQPPYRAPCDCTPADGVFAVLFLAIGFVYMQFVLTMISSLGAGVSAFAGVLLLIAFAYFKKSGVKIQRSSWIIFGYVVLSALYFLLYSNGALGFLNLIFLTACFVYWVAAAAGARIQQRVGSFFAADVFRHIFVVPFANFDAFVKSIGKLASKSGKAKSALALVLGILAAFPLTVIVILLLKSADEAFAGLVKNIIGSFWNHIPQYIFYFLFGIPVAFYLFGLIFGSAQKRKTDAFTEERARAQAKRLGVIPRTAAYGALASFLIVYTLFYAAQLQYLFSAFRLALPPDFSYAEYARRGFFELCVVACINLLVILFTKFFVRRLLDDGRTPKLLKAFNICLSAYTVGFIAIGISKMTMYIGAYGLTPLRVYTTWFMIFLFLVFAVLILQQFLTKLNITRIVAYAGATMFLVLCLSNTDALIAKYNVNQYLKGNLQMQVWDLAALSDAAAPSVEKIILNTDDPIVKDEAKIVLDGMRNNMRVNTWKAFTLSSHRAQAIFERYPTVDDRTYGEEETEVNNNLFIVNESAAEIASIGIFVDNQSHGVSNADNSPIAQGETMGFQMDAKQGCVFRVEIADRSGGLIAQGEFTKDFVNGADEQVYLYIRDDENGSVYITDSDLSITEDSISSAPAGRRANPPAL